MSTAEGDAPRHHHLPSVLRLPSPRALARHAIPSVVESSLVPTALFFIVLSFFGFRGALLTALGWSYAAILRRGVRRQRQPALLLVGALLLTARTVISLITGSAILYFVQPTMGTILVALTFLVTALAGRPVIERLAHDFCPINPEVASHPSIRRFFVRISLLWAVIMLSNAAVVLALLFITSLHAFVIERTAVTWVLTIGGIAFSTWLFVRTLRRAGIMVRFSGALATADQVPGPGGPTG